AGFSLFWNEYRTIAQHEVRERDYFFVVSFQVWGIFVALGLVSLVRSWHSRGIVAAAVLITLLPFAANFSAASRRHGPDATIARDLAYNLLQSVEPYGVLFGYGDNDTFPVWYLQEVEGVRQDVTLINLSLANLDWYLRQLASRPTRPFDPSHAPAIYRTLAPPPLAARPPAGAPRLFRGQGIARAQALRVSHDGVAPAGRFARHGRNGQSLQASQH